MRLEIVILLHNLSPRAIGSRGYFWISWYDILSIYFVVFWGSRMIQIQLKQFQQKAIDKILEQFEDPNGTQKMFVKAPTGSGKTITLIGLIERMGLNYFGDYVFCWLTPGKGELEEQSEEKMRRFSPSLNTGTLTDILTSGFNANTTYFINWESITKKGNLAIKDGERKNLYAQISNAHSNGLKFIVLIDEEHQNNTRKARDIIDAMNPVREIRVSATPDLRCGVDSYVIDEEAVIAEQLITKALYINKDLNTHFLRNQNDEINLLISKADEVRNEIYNAYRANGENINPLVLIQFPSLSDDMITQVEKALELRGYTYENRMVASWFSAESQADKDKHSKKLDKINIGNVGDPDSITRHDAKPCFLLFKQALATGWDCPRAKVLVKLRDNMNETFEIQTLGRLRRMPNAIHYGTDTLDCAYLYTLDEKYKEAVINDGSGYEVRRVFIKPDAKSIKIHKEYIDNNRNYIDMKIARKLLYQYFVDKFSLISLINNPNGEKSNRDILEAHGFIFGTKLHREYLSARLRTLNELIEATNNSIIKFEVDTHKHGMLMRHEIGRFSKILGLDYDNTRTLVRTLFMGGNARTAALAYKILPLEIREYYAFIINNKNLLYELFVEFERNTASLSSVPVQGQLYIPIKEEVSSILSEEVYPVDSRGQIINFIKNVYEKYDSSMVDSFRSTSEKLFEKYCESLDNVKFIYKNGDKGVNYISIIYQMVFGKARSFYPDYLVQMSDGTIWIIETKGGETKSGQDKNIDIEAKHKFDALVVYAKKYNLKYGFVRDKNTDLYINTTDKWVDDLSDTSVWKRIETVLK